MSTSQSLLAVTTRISCPLRFGLRLPMGFMCGDNMCNLVFDLTHHNRVYLTKSAGINHSVILTPKKYRQMLALYRIVDVIKTIATYYTDLFWGQDVRPGIRSHAT
jgi:hypothetical protein